MKSACQCVMHVIPDLPRDPSARTRMLNIIRERAERIHARLHRNVTLTLALEAKRLPEART